MNDKIYYRIFAGCTFKRADESEVELYQTATCHGCSVPVAYNLQQLTEPDNEVLVRAGLRMAHLPTQHGFVMYADGALLCPFCLERQKHGNSPCD